MALTKVTGNGLGAVTQDGAATFNEGSADVDFRVEGNGDANLLCVDASADKVGIGTNAPLDLLHLKGGGANDSVGAPFIRLQKQSGGAVDDNQIIGGISFFVNDDGVDSGATKERAKIMAESQNTSSGTSLQFFTGNSNADIAEHMRIIADGRVGIGTAAPLAKLHVNQAADSILFTNTFTNVGHTVHHYSNSEGSGAYRIRFDSNDTVVGSIGVGTSSTAYNTSSDYRLKENVDHTWDATTRLKQLKPARFNFIADDTNTLVDGFLAHEVSSIVPEAISGAKDATQDVGTVKDAEGVVLKEKVLESEKQDDETWTKTGTENVYQGIDQSKLVPLLVKTIQELEARITALEA